ncbi:GntR family transcriptional regulator [Cytobacillus spongiae]|uniref:GntR family transcriptional regulator n=1 Tax=Cytobacillus spongiae TaxID=2901381 RepID=UPI001F1D5CE1|nr:GntR family transcriptional regulator [Cytobacillus spongiae]UII55226.1 GntR family transcriptional regulator [Cytobacillus spongiae]
MLITIDPESDIPIFIQLTNEIIEAIARGSLSTGDTLPSVRSLASDLSINMHTVNKSYHELVSKGIIEIVPKKGAVIVLKEGGLSKDRLQSIAKEFRPLVAEVLVRGMQEKELQQLISDIITNIKEG